MSDPSPLPIAPPSAASEHPPRLLLIEDDPDTAELMRECIEDHFGAGVVRHVTALAPARAYDLDQIDLVICDMNLPDGLGLELLPEMLRKRPGLPVVFVTAEGILENAIRAVQQGAYDYVVKAGDYLFSLPVIIEKNLALYRIKCQNAQLLEEVRIKNQQLQGMVDQLAAIAATDPLTGLANRRSFNEALERQLAEANRRGDDLALMLMDLDGFKQLNDTLGHPQGDAMLMLAAKVLMANCRASDVAGRFGGDEFVLLLCHTDFEEAMTVGRRVTEQFADDAAATLAGAEFTGRVTMSLGLTTLRRGGATGVEQLISQADHAMYAAKAQPRTQVIAYPDQSAVPAEPLPA